MNSKILPQSIGSIASHWNRPGTGHVWWLTPVILILCFLANLSAAAATDTFAATGPLATARSLHTSTLLADGKVLVAGGHFSDITDIVGHVISSAERYDPSTTTWSVASSMKTARQYHSATLLNNGKVLVVGGMDASFNDYDSAELYDPVTDSWSDTGSLITARDSHTATLLADGKVLVAGGYGFSGPLDSAELYDPATGKWTSAGTLGTARYSHTATLLASGKVIVTGGSVSGNSSSDFLKSAELYNPATNSWSIAASMDSARFLHTATLLADGKVLVVGGQDLDSAELYDPIANSWGSAGSIGVARWNHTAILLPNHKVLVAGGFGFGGHLESATLYDPSSTTWSLTGSLLTGRYSHTATLLTNNKVLIAGGSGTGNFALSSTELYTTGSDLTALEAWRMTNFGNSANIGDGADLYDYDKDGIVNLMEYAFGLNPKENSAGQLPSWQKSGNNYVISFTQPDTVGGITYGAEWSTTLQAGDWHAIKDTGTAPQHAFSVSADGKPKLFLRLNVSAP
jgi:N-acetylneuraminic acid mutarotase